MKRSLAAVLALTVISGVCAAVLAFVNGITAAPIAAMRVRQTLDAARSVMPPEVVTVEKAAFAHGEGFVGRDAAGRVAGYAVEGRDPRGYGGEIVLMVGFRPDRRTVVCYRVLAAAETPGLGMKLRDAAFVDRFRGKDARALAVVRGGTPGANEVEAITSATITSKAVCRAVRSAAAKL